jgi:hypothetical protein
MDEYIVDWYRRLTDAAKGKGRRLAATRLGVAYTPTHGAAGYHRRMEQQRREIARASGMLSRAGTKANERRHAEAKMWRAKHRTAPVP